MRAPGLVPLFEQKLNQRDKFVQYREESSMQRCRGRTRTTRRKLTEEAHFAMFYIMEAIIQTKIDTLTARIDFLP